jgi:hypothetical protein
MAKRNILQRQEQLAGGTYRNEDESKIVSGYQLEDRLL